MYLSEDTVEQMREQLRYKDEIMMEALRKRDAHKLAAEEYKTKLQQALVEVERLQLHVAQQSKEVEQIRNENRDLEAFNRMLQKMFKRMIKKENG
jgi:hypothetical protein